MAISVTLTCNPCSAGRQTLGNLQVANLGANSITLSSAQVVELTQSGATIGQPNIFTMAVMPGTGLTTIAAGAVANFPFTFVCQSPVNAGPAATVSGAIHTSPWGNGIVTFQALVYGTDAVAVAAVSDVATCNVAVGAIEPTFPPSQGGALQFNVGANAINFLFI